MGKASFSSFKELLAKKDLSAEAAEGAVDYRAMARIFRHVPKDLLRANLSHFPAEQSALLLPLLDDPKICGDKASDDADLYIKQALAGLPDGVKRKLVHMMADDVEEARADAARLQDLARRYTPRDPAEEKKELEERIAGLRKKLVSLEMDLMQMEKDDQQQTELYRKLRDTRERDLLFVNKLEKQLKTGQAPSRRPRR